MIEVKNLTKHYSLLESPAVKDVSFCAKEGKITILLGPNGAGKSTLMNIITGNLKPTSGMVLRNGRLISAAIRTAVWRQKKVLAMYRRCLCFTTC